VSDQTLGVYLSTDSTIDSSDVFLGQFSTGAIASNKSYLGNLTTLALPDDLASGTYFVGVVADYKKSIAESNEGNNIAVASIEVKRIEPDIQVTFSGLKESIVAAGSPIVLDDLRISNDGDADAQQVSVAVYLSDDAVIDSSDNYLGRYTVDEILAGGAKLIDLTTVAIPEDLESGTYYVGVVADGSNTIKESDENNNTSIARPVRVLSADEIDPDTGLPFLAGFATKLSSISVRGANAVYDTGKFVYDTARQVWLATKDGQTFESDSGLGSDDIVEYLTDQVHDNLIDFAREELEDDPLALAALDRYEQTQNALTFKELTSNFLNKTMARIENTVTDYLDPTKSENERRDLDLDAVEADLKKYWEDLVDLQTGLPVNQTLGTLSRIFNSIRMNFGNSALEGRLDIDPSEGGTRTMTAASGHHDATMGSESNDRIFGGDLIDLIYARGGDDYINGGHGADILIGSEGNDQLYGGVGSDIISGGLGNDIMSGGTGFDRFVIGTDAGVDRILDFAAGRKSKEIIEIRSDIVGSLAELKASSIRTAEGLLITVDEDQTLLLENVASKQLHLNDFAFL
jgi:Ca2+-binding RTX toxin-like protein